jgi:hypothetical protein
VDSRTSWPFQPFNNPKVYSPECGTIVKNVLSRTSPEVMRIEDRGLNMVNWQSSIF